MAQQLASEKSMFLEALEMESDADRRRFLDEACQADPSLRAKVQALLDAHARPQPLLDVTSASTLDKPGTLIGPYKLLEQIGEGGMGIVYMAEQPPPLRRLVALKIIKPGMDSKQVIARFEAERQALAMMDHPNIAKVFDAGTTGESTSPALAPSPASGRPYFVMELVRGIPINEFCDQKRLTVRERLELFIQVCQAVQHAHQKGIIHRDLKPTNVLVTMHDVLAVPKVIDFGIAKALGAQLTEHTLHTGFAQLVGTPLYMSPEQAQMNQLGVDTRSDVYSLGVLLYELLTGTTPFDKETLTKAGFDEMRRIIREVEPETVSARIARTRRTGARGLGLEAREGNQIASPLVPSPSPQPSHRSELDWIVMKSLEKDRSRRYESASALAADIQRYLSDEPVLACPPTTMYRFQKFARKHKPALATAAALALCLLLGTTVSAWQAARATTAEAQANANEQKAVANEQKANANAAQAKEKAQEATTQRDEAQKQRDEVKALADKLAAKEEELERTMYADHIYMAKEAWDRGNVTRATSLLKRHLSEGGETDRRGFEWHYLNRMTQLGPLVSIQTGGVGIYSDDNPRLSPDGTRLFRFIPSIRRGPGKTRDPATASPTTEPTVKVWNLETGQMESASVVSGASNMARFSPDGTRLVERPGQPVNPGPRVPAAGDLKVWDSQTGKEVLARTGAVGRVVFSANSQLLACSWEDRALKVFDLRTGQESCSLKGHSGQAHVLVFSTDGRKLTSASQFRDNNALAGDIKVWDLQTGEELWTASGITSWIDVLAFSPDGRHLAGAWEGTVKLWNAQTGESHKSLPYDIESAYELEFSPDSTRLTCWGDKEEQDDYVDYAKMWNVQSGQEMLSFTNSYLYFSPDGKRVAAEDREKSRIKIFDAQTGQQVMNVPGTGPEFSLDSRRLAVKSDGVRVWDLQTTDEINHIRGVIRDIDDGSRLAFSQDGKRLIVDNGFSGVHIWDVQAKQERTKTLTFHGLNRNFGSGPSNAVFSADLTRAAGISFSKVKIFDGHTGQELRTLKDHRLSVVCVAITSDGKRVASSAGYMSASPNANPGVVKIWDAETGNELHTIQGHAPAIGYLAFSPDGKKLAGMAYDRMVKIWDAQSGQELHTLGEKSTGPNPNPVVRLAFSPDSKRLVAAGKLWDVETGRELVNLKGAGQDCMGFSPDGKYIVGGRRGAVADAQTGEVLFTLLPADSPGGYPWFTFSPDGKRLASSGGIWDAQTGQELLSFGDSRNGGSGQVAFTPDGHRLAVVPFNGNEVTIYDSTPLPEKP